MRTCLVVIALAAMAGCADEAAETSASDDSALVGGTRDSRWAASGYLARGDSMKKLDLSKPVCGATLIAPKVAVTAAHCLVEAQYTYAFGTGDVGTGEIVRVAEVHAHPEFHPEAEGKFDLTHTLRNYDLAYLILEKAVTSVAPAALPTSEVSMGSKVQAFGYEKATRKSTPAYVTLQLSLGADPIFEVHPEKSSALCIADGDDGSAVFERDTSRQVLVGIFVGSVTGGLTDCRRGTQFLNGYESAFGYRDFLQEGIARGNR